MRDGQVRPLALPFHAQMRPISPLRGPTLERGPQSPALDEPAQDLLRILARVGAPSPRAVRSSRAHKMAQALDADNAAAAQHGRELERGEAAVGHQHQVASEQPAQRLQHHLPPLVCQLLVPPAVLAAVTLGGGENRQERRWCMDVGR